MLDSLRGYMSSLHLQPPEIDTAISQAAVLIALTDNSDNPEVVLTQRSQRLSSHSGEVSLPGGKWEPLDTSLEHTALRETREEIGLAPDQVEILGVLPPFETYRGVSVSPFVGVIPEGLEFIPNYDELDSVFLVPVQFFVEDRRIRTDRFDRIIGHSWSPAYHFDGYEIWGFTARLMVNFLSRALDLKFDTDNPAPTKYWPPSDLYVNE